MCALLLKPFVLGYILLALVLQLLVYFKRISLVPRGTDNGVMLLFLLAISMSQRISLAGSLSLRIIILALGFGLVYGASKKLYPSQYRSLINIKDPEGYEKLLDEGESFDEKKGVFTLLNKDSKARIKRKIREERSSFFDLIMALILAGLLIYFGLN